MTERPALRRLADPSALLPDADTDLLLRAAFARDDVARAAWLDLAPRLDVDTLVAESHELLASVAATLRRLDLAPADLPRFDGIRKRLWTMNARKLRSIASAVEAIRDTGTEPVVVGPVAVIAHHGDLGVRHITEADIAVRADSAAPAGAALEGSGWTPSGTRTDGFLLDIRAARFTRDGVVLSLRWASDSRRGTWPWPTDSLIVDVAGTPLPVASRADTLAFALVEGLAIVGYVASRRQADAYWLAGPAATPSLDHDAFVARVRERRGGWEAHRQLAHAGRVLGVAVPAVLWHDGGGPRRHRVGEALAARGRSRLPAAFLRRARGQSLLSSARTLPRFLREVWELPPTASVWREGVRRIRRTG